MSNRVLIIGGVAGGASAAARVRRLDEHAEIVMFERGPYVSFSNCALPFHLSGIVENSDAQRNISAYFSPLPSSITILLKFESLRL